MLAQNTGFPLEIRAVTIQVCPLVSESPVEPIFVKQSRWTVCLSSQLTPEDRRRRRSRIVVVPRVPRVSLERWTKGRLEWNGGKRWNAYLISLRLLIHYFCEWKSRGVYD